MFPAPRLASLALLFSVTSSLAAADSVDWPMWRGPLGTGVAPADQHPPLTWSKDQNVRWKSPIPGRGHSSPTVVGERVFLATAEEDSEIQSVLCYDRETGRQLWKAEVHRGGLDRKGNKKTSQASSTVACDGDRLYVNFLNGGAVHTTALDLAGKQVWQTKVADFATHQGFGSSPALFGSLVFVTADSKSGGAVAALDRATGKIAWLEQRPAKANYASPIVLRVAGRDQLLVSGCDLASSFDPATGNKLWEVAGATTECVTTMVSDGRRVFVSGGYPRRHVQAIEADGSGKSAWENNSQVYVPSMIASGGYLHAILDAGVACCWKADTGEELWKERLGGTFSASLVLVGDRLFATSESGQTFIWRASPAKCERLGDNQLGDEVFATPAICGSRIYMRVVEHGGGQRQEMLYCLGQK
ncbi:MAG: PQQ-binding-like beta-propeller repeat protein [Pirellulaceae bacterium]|nr:PQQ-binding-like beta-propeller repeat protein [Pirellulaceae bacterium]